MKIFRIISVICLFSILFSCAVDEKHYSGNRDFNKNNLSKIEIGVSTKKDIEDAFGDPIDTRNIDEGIDLWTYEQTEWDLKYSGASILSSLPLFNVITLGEFVPKSNKIGHIQCKIFFKDGIVDDCETIIFDKEGKFLVDPRIEENKRFYNQYKSNRSAEMIVIKPISFKRYKKRAVLDIKSVEFWNLNLVFDLSVIPKNIKIKGALLKLYTKEKYLCAQTYDNSAMYAPYLHKVYSESESYDPYSIGLPAVDSQNTFKAGSSAVISQLSNILLLGQLGFRSIFEIDQTGWDTWVISDFLPKNYFSPENKLYLLLQPAYSEARGFTYGPYGLKYPVLFKYYDKAELIKEGKPLEYEPHIEIFYEEIY